MRPQHRKIGHFFSQRVNLEKERNIGNLSCARLTDLGQVFIELNYFLIKLQLIKNDNMEINITTLERYCLANGFAITTSMTLDDDETCLVFIKGTDAQGSLRVFLTPQNISDILDKNGMFGPDGKVTYERDLPHEELLKRVPSERDKDTNIEKLIYNLLSRYIIQLLSASLGKNFFPEIIPLDGHRAAYFRS